jgi:hypothetical protein
MKGSITTKKEPVNLKSERILATTGKIKNILSASSVSKVLSNSNLSKKSTGPTLSSSNRADRANLFNDKKEITDSNANRYLSFKNKITAKTTTAKSQNIVIDSSQ